MVNVGEVVWDAKVTGISDANRKASNYTDTATDMADTVTDVSTEFADGNQKAQEYTQTTESLNTETERFDTKAGVLTGTLGFLFTTIGGGIAQAAGLAGAWKAVTGAFGAAVGYIGGVEGAIAGVTAAGAKAKGLVIGFGKWLAAGSTGALAFAGALGFAVGLLGVFGLEATGALDKVRSFGKWVGGKLPPAFRDAFIALLSITVSGLATIGAAIAGFAEGYLRGGLQEGLDQAVANAEQTLDIFVGAWVRTLARVRSLGASLMDATAETLAGAWNATIPASVTFPRFSIGGGQIGTVLLGQRYTAQVPQVEFGGWTQSLPQLESGGKISSTGAFVGHAGEMVVPADVTRRFEQQVVSGGGGGQTVVEVGSVSIGDQSLDIRSLTSRELRDVVDELAKLLGDKVSARVS